jgi:hypothetical protein
MFEASLLALLKMKVNLNDIDTRVPLQNQSVSAVRGEGGGDPLFIMRSIKHKNFV